MISIVIAAYNEEHRIGKSLLKVKDYLTQQGLDYEIIVVDDGSTDDTAQVLTTLGETVSELKIVPHAHNRGYGVAVRSGLARAGMDYVFLTDGDGQFDLEDLPAAIQLLREHDVIAGYRTHRQDGWWRRLWGRSWTALVNHVFGLGVRDVNCAFKLVPRSLLLSSDLRSHGALISAEILFEARRLELSVAECAVSHYPRRTGRQTGASLRVIATAFMELVACLPRKAPSPPRGEAA